MFVMPAGAPIARPTPGPFGVDVPDPDPLSNDEPVLREPSVEFRMLKTPLLPKEKRPKADFSAVFIVPTEESVAAEIEAALVVVFR